ncbi:MAG: ribokinase [Hyphomicrobiales bacterium]|nr:ribokinase [Hyphomicrobiales bacterium]MDE2115545.1 ribokinase [Hyphomicrobiales bacterium]
MIVVFGSINIDLVTRVDKIAAPGETVLGLGYHFSPGGKGANQALAASRAGAPVRMFGAVGQDAFADAALALLRQSLAQLNVVVLPEASTGAAFISVDSDGQNAITVAAGANMQATAAPLADLPWQTGDYLVLQREVSDAENLKAAHIARAHGARVIYNTAPAGVVSSDQLAAIDILIANEHEAAILARDLWGERAQGRTPQAFASAMARAHSLACIITLGGAGAIAASVDGQWSAKAPAIEVVDTTGAGDAFVGALAAALARGEALPQALAEGVAAGSLACMTRSAQAAFPNGVDIHKMAATVTVEPLAALA